MKNNLARLRRICRLSQTDVSTLMGKYLGKEIDFTTISSHESGRRGLGQEEILAYARLYKVSPQLIYQSLTSDKDVVEALRSEEWEWPI